LAHLLHLSDLHLGGAPDAQVLDDYKSEIVPVAERNTRHRALRSTLRALGGYLRRQGEVLDAIIITGDVTIAGRRDGLEQISGLLAELKESCPPPERIMVTPGNHDVAWETPPGSAARYATYLATIRSAGYVTPILDGIDIDENGTRITALQHHLVLDGGAVVVVAINSCNYSGMLEPLRGITEDEWQRIPSLLASDEVAVRKELRRLRLHDVARVSATQLDALADVISGCDGRAVIAAAVHHHLLPVSTREEFKSFESITNLGLLRSFLRDNNVRVVLHGHKHEHAIYWDHIYDIADATPAHQTLVISGSTIGGVDFTKRDVARLVTIEARTRAPEASVGSIPAIDPGHKLTALPPTQPYKLWEATTARARPMHARVVTGQTLDETYDHIVAIYGGVSPTTLIPNLLCEISDVPPQPGIPVHYPEIPGEAPENRQQWFEHMVRWWQRRETRLRERFSFTHGERLYRYGASATNQVADAIRALREKENTSRAVMTLLLPSFDLEAGAKRKFPHFCTLQFYITSISTPQLHCVAYFRKQEMRYWWPVNVAELVSVREEVFAQLQTEYQGITRGTITTIAGIAYASDTCPKVAVPLIDRLLDEDPDALWELTYALCEGQRAHPEILLVMERVLTELVPEPLPDPDGVPVALDGLEDLIRHVARYAAYHDRPEMHRVADLFNSILRVNREYARDTAVDRATIARHQKWLADCERAVAQIRAELQRANA
jgi:3',5'-cyclic AMP phosphodiesterase CpdA